MIDNRQCSKKEEKKEKKTVELLQDIRFESTETINELIQDETDIGLSRVHIEYDNIYKYIRVEKHRYMTHIPML